MKSSSWIKAGLAAAALAAAASLGQAQGVNPADIGNPPVDSWLTYHGDWSGRRFSTLNRINDANVQTLTQAWLFKPAASGPGDVVGGQGAAIPSGVGIKATPLLWRGVLYFTAQNHVWAIDARTGQQKWHYAWKTTGGTSIGNRGVGLWNDTVFFLTTDNNLLALDINTGAEKWTRKVGNINLDYWTTASPMVIGDHVIYGYGTDRFDFPAYLESRDPRTGALQWQWRVTPKPGEPGFNSWPSELASENGGGTPWVPGVYDKDQNLYIFGTGNPQAVLDGRARAGDNLYTTSIVAIDPDTGKMKWAYQVSPHDTHDWDASTTPILVDGMFEGRPRKLVLVANRNGYFFVIDRITGKGLKSFPMSDLINWNKPKTRPGTFQPEPDPAKESSIGGTYVRPGSSPGFTNWQPHSYSPDSGLFYLGTNLHQSIFYSLYEGPEPRGWAAREQNLGTLEGSLKAIDYMTGKVVWEQPSAMTPNPTSGLTGILSTSGNLVFASNGGGDFIAFNAKTGKPLWHVPAGNISNGPMTYELDGKQYVVAATNSGLYAYALP